MNVSALRTLLERFWVVKDREKELYYKTKEGLETAVKFAREYPGWRLINNERILKLEKIPAHAEPFMGITDFADKSDYVLFCALLIYLEDREDGEPFLLSELIDMMEAQLKPVMEIDWTSFTLRRSLIRVMQFAKEKGLLLLHEGNVEAVSSDIRQEVLYENTGLSRFFAVSFPSDTSGFRSWEDYEKENISEADTDRGHFRINRVYRELLACPAMYWASSEDPDSLYLKNQRQWVSKYLDENLAGRLDIHKNAAFFVLDEEDTFGEVFPGTGTICDVVLLVCESLREYLKDGDSRNTGKELSRSFIKEGDTILLSEDEFASLLEKTVSLYQAAWSKEFRELPKKKLETQVTGYMEDWMLLRREGDLIRIYPAAFKFTGRYPADFHPESLMPEEAGGNKAEGGSRPKPKTIRKKKSETDGQLSLFD